MHSDGIGDQNQREPEGGFQHCLGKNDRLLINN